MSAALTAERTLRIGELAELTGTTPRTIRYYEEIGLLGGSADRAQGKHRCYTQSDVDRIREVVRLRDLLGLSLDQLSQLAGKAAHGFVLSRVVPATTQQPSFAIIVDPRRLGCKRNPEIVAMGA